MNKVEQYINKMNTLLKLKNEDLLILKTLPLDSNYYIYNNEHIIYHIKDFITNIFFYIDIYNQYNIYVSDLLENILKIQSYSLLMNKKYSYITNLNYIIIYNANYNNLIDIINIIFT